MSKKLCSSCGEGFSCINETPGCWCESYNVLPENLKVLKKTFKNCLCEGCLSKYGTKSREKENK